MLSITKTPVLILSAPRTGSTVLCEFVGSISTKRLSIFMEPEYQSKAALDAFQSFYKQSKDFVIKLHATQMYRYDTTIMNLLLQEACKIRIQRKDFIKQVASMYIAESINKFQFFKSESQPPYTVPINITHINNCIESISNANEFLSNLPYNFDLDLFYEDLPLMDNCNVERTPQPTNYEEILIVTKILCGALNKN